MSTLSLVYPHQLFARHPAMREGQSSLLIEDPLFFGNDPHWPMSVHKQRLVLHRASMKAWAAGQEGVSYIGVPAGADLDSAGLLEKEVSRKVTRLELVDPVDDVLMRRIRRFAEGRGMELVIHPSPNFLTPPDLLMEHTGPGRKKPFMASFYQAQRQRMGILVEADGSPTGGRWSFDEENRQRFPEDHLAPMVPRITPNEHVKEAAEWVEARFPENPGRADTFDYPVTRRGALAWLDRFLEQRLADFGAYEDALSRNHRVLFHSVLTPVLNIGLLDPREIVDRALAHAAKHRVPMNSLEGFIRQVIGWREFMAGIYRHRGVAIRNGNFWKHDRPMPRALYDGTTGIPPVDDTIRRVLDHGWCHHIERLMVMGNFMLLCRIRPDDVYRWFMELFVDAYDWVMVPNVYGMSQFADGGTFTTKPYLSGSNYLRKMSYYPKGEWCDTWDALSWSFISDHLEFFGANPRLSMMARTWEKLPAAKKEAHHARAASFLKGLR
ncbi:cryptochrome/photolyase family protein [Luteolibacter flavescens]|uniref:Cryptochrome/photolyase family protein n=1 Tax=Luteolibacter flavescens TaxID=1859460 RepID=A0ABT3FWA5_9BACT|nr:cryptochrome/photolyase family protein [Luteolibacter flavescens]MCW1887260.1 cryptochrome/photolyase family protein [Luteolibacter flavescens]